MVGVQEILFVDSSAVFSEVHRHRDIGWQNDVLNDIDDVLCLGSIGLVMPLRDVYYRFHAAMPSSRAGLAKR